MDIKQTSDGMFVAARFIPTKKKFRTTLTETFNPSEATSVDDLPNVRKYSSKDSCSRAIRKFKAKL